MFSTPLHLCTKLDKLLPGIRQTFKYLALSHHNTEVLRAVRNKINKNQNKTTMGL